MNRGFTVAFVIAMGCGRIGFDATGDGGAGDAAKPSVFTAVGLPPGGTITGLAYAPDGSMYAVLANQRVERTTSKGALWTACGAAGEVYIDDLAIDPATGTIYLAGKPDVMQSTDACASWTPTTLGKHSFTVAVLGTRVFAGAGDGVYVMSAGAWSQVSTPMNGHAIWDLAVEPASGKVYVASDNGIALSVDSGATWALSTTGLPAGGADFIRIDPQNPQWVVTQADYTTGQQLYRSSDGGATWSQVFEGGFSFAFDPSDASFAAYDGYSTGLTTSTNGAVSFGGSDLRSAAMQDTGVFDLAFDAASGLYAATGRGIFYAPTHALAWSEVDTGVAAWNVVAIATSTSGDLYLATDAGVLHSGDGGASWTEGSTGITNSSEVTGVAAVPGTTNSIVIASINSVARSDDRGQTFTTLYVPTQSDGYNVLSLQLAGTTILAGTEHGVLTSPTPWSTFTFHQLGGADRSVWAVLALDTAATKILAATESGLFYSGDGGATFGNISNGLTDLDVHAVAQLPDGTLLCGTGTAGVFRASSPSGPWTPSGLAQLDVSALLVVQGRVVATTRTGVFVSADGSAWAPVNGLEQMSPQSLAIDSSGQLLVGTFGFGLFRTPPP